MLDERELFVEEEEEERESEAPEVEEEEEKGVFAEIGKKIVAALASVVGKGEGSKKKERETATALPPKAEGQSGYAYPPIAYGYPPFGYKAFPLLDKVMEKLESLLTLPLERKAKRRVKEALEALKEVKDLLAPAYGYYYAPKVGAAALELAKAVGIEVEESKFESEDGLAEFLSEVAKRLVMSKKEAELEAKAEAAGIDPEKAKELAEAFREDPLKGLEVLAQLRAASEEPEKEGAEKEGEEREEAPSAEAASAEAEDEAAEEREPEREQEEEKKPLLAVGPSAEAAASAGESKGKEIAALVNEMRARARKAITGSKE